MARVPRVICSLHFREMTVRTIGMPIECVLKDGSPYYKIYVDIYECKDGDCTVMLPAPAPVAEHYQDGYDRWPTIATITLR